MVSIKDINKKIKNNLFDPLDKSKNKFSSFLNNIKKGGGTKFIYQKLKEREEELKSIIDIYKLLKKDESQYNLYNQSKILDKLIEKAENELKELNNE